MQRKMNNSTSNTMMEKEFAILENLPRIQPPQGLYGKIMAKIDNSKQFRVSKTWLRTVAAIFAVILCLEVALLTQSNQQQLSSEIEVLVEQNNDQLYYE